MKLTDKQKQKIMSDYLSNGNYSETGRMNGCSDNTVRYIVKHSEGFSEKLEQKQEENTKDILEYMETITTKQKKIIDLSLDVLEEKLSNPDMFTNVKDVATVYGIIFDKALKYKELKLKQQEVENSKNGVEDLTTLADMLGFDKK